MPEDDWTENWFAQGNHRYSHLSPPIDANYFDMINALNRFGVHPNQKEPFVPGQPYVGDVNIPVPFDRDDVESTALYDANGNQIGVRNETLPNHALHPGVVQRTIVEQNGDKHIQTQGGGYGWLGGPNIGFDGSVWGDVDDRVQDALNK